MKFEIVAKQVKGIPFIRDDSARYLYDLIISQKLFNILELGFAHGTASCYIAAALDELGNGKLTSVDLLSAKDVFNPNIESLLDKTKLLDYVDIYRMQTGYNWFLHEEIVKQTYKDYCTPKYDLCIIDGPKNWTIDGYAFFLVDKLLKENGYVIFDDYLWTYAGANNSRTETDGITHRNLSQEELVTPHVREIFELLVKQHSSYKEYTILPDFNWAIARKGNATSKSYTIKYTGQHYSLMIRFFRYLKRKLKKMLRFFTK